MAQWDFRILYKQTDNKAHPFWTDYPQTDELLGPLLLARISGGATSERESEKAKYPCTAQTEPCAPTRMAAFHLAAHLMRILPVDRRSAPPCGPIGDALHPYLHLHPSSRRLRSRALT